MKRKLDILEFPKISFLESMSLTKDGGVEQVDKYLEAKKAQEEIQSKNTSQQTLG
jgi:hypothetical protein